MAAPPTTGVSTNNNKISVNLHLFLQLQFYLEMRSMKQKKIVFINKMLTRKKTTLYQTTMEQARKKILSEHLFDPVVQFRSWK